MRLNRRAFALTLVATLATAPAAWASGPQVGKPAPGFSAVDTAGKPVTLSDYAGKTVVLEWTNHDCPFVRKHYGAHAMQALQKTWTGRGVVWLTVISSAPGEQGAIDGAEADRLTSERGAAPTAVLLDPAGTVGRAYDAKTTPHMFIVSGDGTLLYQGGIDDKPSADVADLKTAKNYVDAALTEIAAGKPVTVKTSRPYGCTVKYSS
ncbi:thioredoxin family protein [Methylobacterium sp. BTF04]|uniref:thioredoxin family protein n=1 Tax=Methylobacterium sp. BTF04 TaxID=2708300 RepID=UPI0013CF6566|nr:thioredoxin family protein [Methylobacterium sp. BTF04]NEU13288.1 thioredoxin family protein [Methylobacterium sp. BTF04]